MQRICFKTFHNILFVPSLATVSYTPVDKLNTNTTVYNVSHLLDSLLSNYDSSLRPDFGGKNQYHISDTQPLFPGPPVLIEVNMQVRSMGPISEMDMVSMLDRQKYHLTLL